MLGMASNKCQTEYMPMVANEPVGGFTCYASQCRFSCCNRCSRLL